MINVMVYELTQKNKKQKTKVTEVVMAARTRKTQRVSAHLTLVPAPVI